jgi:uncharacterized membrane protein YphA (DoxX/SURF4 family)
MLDTPAYVPLDIARFTDPLGQLLILSVFWGGAIINLLNWKTAIKYFESRRSILRTPFILMLGIFLQFIGGLLFFNPSTRNTGVLVLIIFTAVSSWLCYNFWQREGVDRYRDIISFLSNIGIIGALLLFLNRPHLLDGGFLRPLY